MTTDRPNKKPEVPLAVALSYDLGGIDAPKVVAGGRGAVAEQILSIAFAQGVKVREDKDLANLLSVIDIDSEIPLEAFAAVAEILAYVYKANGNLAEAMEQDETRHQGNNTAKSKDAP